MIEKNGLKILFIDIVFLIMSAILFKQLAIVFLAFAVFTLIFFRDPPRKIGIGVVSPADGRIDYISGNRLEIFMSPFDCHVNRSPVNGRVVRIRFKEGKKPPAFKRCENARMNEILIKNEDGYFKVIQVAGIFARRIVCYVKEGDFIKKGEKIGSIVFGSRVILEVPECYKFVKRVGERVKAGETIALRYENT